ncbi:NADPH-dependent F420 reductase [Euzebya tangerina]|uniref:NADPH-dependent F420 reductase n=1 Tax=Euzebya tangerina TaxID=591198 RepID=UPI00196AD3E7|nr:NAD(P)-binding domain-containing protein [Euzebya tangerina]
MTVPTPLTVALLGAGPVARGLAGLTADAGHAVTFGVRRPKEVAATTTHAVAAMYDAARDADIAIVAVPYRVIDSVLPDLAPALNGTIVVDATNPLHEDYSPMQPSAPSAGEHVQQLLPDARVVKAFNTIFATVMDAERLDRDGRLTTAFLAGDDSEAVATVQQLAADLGYAPVVTGPLANSRYLEAMAHLNISIAFGQGGGADAAFLYHQAA